MERFDRALTAAASLLIAVLGFLPLTNWIAGGYSAEWYSLLLPDWLSGTGIVLGVGIILAILSRRLPMLWRDGRLTPLTSLASRRNTALLVAAAAGIAYASVAWIVFDGKPLLIDEIIQVFQGRIFASGRLWLPAPTHPEFTSSLHLVDVGGRVYGQFPPGGPAMLALGTLLRAEWLVGPLFGVASVLLLTLLVRKLEPRPRVALAATLCFAFAPFTIFMSGSHMNHVPALTWLVLGCWGLALATADGGARFRTGMVAGLGFGMAATIRPVDALAFALPAAGWLLWRAGRRRGLAPLLGAGFGMAIPIAALLWVNNRTTGAPLLFGYNVLWGSTQGLGFHATPWGEGHTPLKGLELLNLYFLRLQTYLFELAIPSLLPAAVALALTRRLAALDRYLFASGALLCGFYFAYWFDGFYLGPRFMFPLLPLLALWTARSLAAIRERAGPGLVFRTSVFALIVAVVLGAGTSLPLRIGQYRTGMLSPRWNADSAAAQSGVRSALVFVRESWGAELVARMWALGVSRPDAEGVYRSADACRLELVLDSLESTGSHGPAVASALHEADLGDSSRLQRAEALTGDPSLRLTPGATYPRACLEKIRANRSGFTLYAPLLLARGSRNLYVRDLGLRDTVLLREDPGRPAYLLRPMSAALGAPPVFFRLNPDSMRSAGIKPPGLVP